MNSSFHVKVCGLTDSRNISEVAALDVDYLGLNFYPRSKRFVSSLKPIEVEQKTVGVFVSDEIESIESIVFRYNLSVVQLHGDEDEFYIEKLREKLPSVIIWKAIRIGESLPVVRQYQGLVDAFLFDTYTPQYGGSGSQFNWDLLRGYREELPYFVGGGIGPETFPEIISLKKGNQNFVGVDINSRFEIAPGVKDAQVVREFVSELRGLL